MLWSWGDNGASQLGLDHTPSRRVCSPQRVSADSFKANLISVVAGDAHCLALDELGGVYVWGRTREGQAGRLSVEPVGTPVFLQALAHEHIKKIACGSDVSYALSASGVLYQFGAVHAPSCRRRPCGEHPLLRKIQFDVLSSTQTARAAAERRGRRERAFFTS